MYSIPNGGKRGRFEAAIMKAEGVRAGVPDLFLPVPRGTAHGLYIEMKVGDGRLSKEQAEFADEAVADGYSVVVAWDWALAKQAVLDYLAHDLPPSFQILKPARRS